MPTGRRRRRPEIVFLRTLATLSIATLLALAGSVAPAAAATADLASTGPQTLASGLSGVNLTGLAVARDGSGGLVYAATSGGVSHVFLSRLLNGQFAAPVQLDTGPLSGASQPVIAADTGGRLLVAFISGGQLYVADTLSASQPLSAPQAIAGSSTAPASNPAIAMNLYGVGYLAYTAADGSGDDVDVQYFNGASWAPASPLAVNAAPGDVAGVGSGAPSVAAASDGVGIVAWGEGGHVDSRRVWGTATSVEVAQDDIASLNGSPELSATSPEVAVGGDSSYPDIVFSESFGSPGTPQTRAMLAETIAERTFPAFPIDGIGTATQNGIEPRVAMSEFGRGLISAVTGGTSGTSTTAPYGIESTVLNNNGAPTTPGAATATASASDPAAVPAVLGSTISALAWSSDSGDGLGEIQLAYADDGITFDPPLALSSTAAGPIQTADGLELNGDSRGDGAVAWVQGSAPALSIETDQLLTPPGIPGLTPAKVVANTATPTLTWNPANEDWGAVTYEVTLDGTPLAQTTATSLPVPTALVDGTHSWSVTATNLAGQSTSTPTGSILIDTSAPRLRLRLTGAPLAKATQHLTLADSDPPNPAEPGSRASGIQFVTVTWGDASKPITTTKLTRFTHAYARPGVYRLSVVASDQTHNATTLTRLIRVLP